MNCVFCYSDAYKVNPAEDRDISRHLAFARRNAARIRSINWGTTENAILDDWFTLVQEVHRIAPHVIQGVTTNGFLGHRCRREPALHETVSNCISDIDVSLDFGDRARHNALRGNASAYDWAIETLQYSQDAGIPRSIVTLGCSETMRPDNLERLFQIAGQFDSNLRINIYRPVHTARLDPVAYRTVKDALLFIVDHFAIVSLADPLFASLMGLHASDPSGLNSLRILPDGTVSPSTYLITPEWKAANILESTPSIDALSSCFPFQRLRDASVPADCSGCILADGCRGGCKDRRILWYGTLEERDPYCPCRSDKDLSWVAPGGMQFAPRTGPLIHDGYLPTLIFRPRKTVAPRQEPDESSVPSLEGKGEHATEG